MVTIQEVDLEVNTEKSKYIFMSYEQNVRQSSSIKIGNIFFENVLQFIYFETARHMPFMIYTVQLLFSLCLGWARQNPLDGGQ